MSILGAVYYEKFTPAHSAFDWIKPERYEYCDGFNETMSEKKSGLLQRIAAVLTAIL